VRSGNLVFTAGQTPKEHGTLLRRGKLGAEIDPAEGARLARRAALNALACAAGAADGDLKRIVRIVKATVFVNSAPGFTGQVGVANGASDLLEELFGENGRPARSAVGVAELPGDAPCEVELVVEVR